MIQFNKSVTVKCPATIANMVCGFDILGMAIEDPFDVMEVTLIQDPAIVITHANNFDLPTAPEHNVAGVALMALQQAYPETIGFKIHIHKNIKPGSGLGSSAASSAGAVVAANILLNNFFTNEQLIAFAMQGEELASGVKHADNITPCIMGNITLIKNTNPLDVIHLSSPMLFVTVVHPQIEVKTSDARNILKKEVLLKDAIRQWANVAGLVSGLLLKDYNLIARSLEDVIIEPIRSILIPQFNAIKTQSIKAGALGGGISGSGPSIFMLSQEKSIALKVEEEMRKIYKEVSIEFKTYVTTISKNGVTIIA
jgi:homoserine kinase